MNTTLLSLCCFICCLCLHAQAAGVDFTPISPAATELRARHFASLRNNNNGPAPTSVAPAASAAAVTVRNEIKELITNLHDRVGILATLDEDQRHRLEVIDKKIDKLLDSNEGRMESLKAQQLNFQQRLDSFEHIQRMSRRTLDELKGESDRMTGPRAARELKHKQKNQAKLKDLSRQRREAQQVAPHVADNMASIFSTQGRADNSNATELDVNKKLDALATFLVSLAYNVRETQENVGRLVQNTNNIKRRLANRKSARLPQTAGAPADERASSCLQSYLAVNGILKLQLTPESESFYVPCEDDGWTVIMNRSSDDTSFERSWLEYKEGFGNLAGDFFIGLDKLHALTSSSLHELRIWLEDFEGNRAVAGYDAFAISGERELYALNLLGKHQQQLQPPAGDSFSYHAGAKFSTFDSDNDNCLACSCAQRFKAAGWFNSCGTSNLFGKYHSENHARAGEAGIFWETFQGNEYSLRRVKMLIRPVAQDEARR
ncbi:angiopoietin-related protein 7 isoform X2 [Drosophila busckii]|uniref:angiopoietin-related protein 7 isoform X2 n=1 Tax=Drosophila busckii TaxID=30019 RepID=UPI00083F2BD6|nr:angiopoietin-related protein 7 isoform X2 [Drosophila busckii]